MKAKRRLWIVALVLIPLGALTALVMVPLVRAALDLKAIADRAHRGRDQLFFETNYEELLAACRTLSGRTVTDESGSRGSFNVHLGKRDPATLSFPKAILDLEPARIFTDWHGRGQVVIELFPGPEWFGVSAFPEGSEEGGDVKLVNGLWYFDSAYNDQNPEYVKKINAMIEEGRKRKAQRRSVSTPSSAGEQKR